MMRSKCVIIVLGVMLFNVNAYPETVSIVSDLQFGASARYGLSEFTAEVKARGVEVRECEMLSQAEDKRVFVVGHTGSGPVRELERTARLNLTTEPESLLVHNIPWHGKDVVLISGADDRGLMYALLDVAEHIRLTGGQQDPFENISNTVEKPAVKTRSVARMFMNRGVVERYLYSEQYWDRYLGMLAKDRFNNFTLMLGYGAAGYFEPPYPFLFDVPEFPNIRVVGLTKEQQKRNLKALHRIIEMAHERGLDFTLALWTHIFVPGHNNRITAGDRLKPGFPTGLSEEELIPFTKVALKRLLREFPGIDRIQFRVHVESSVPLPLQRYFWKQVFKVIEDNRPNLPVDIRVKGLTDDLINDALDSPLDVRLTTKHWGEEMGLPFHPTEDSLDNKYKRRHTYADLLTYPKRYGMLWRLWTHGTVKVLLWGSPEHARRFAQSTLLYGGEGFEIHEPLAMKMGYKMGLHDVEPFDVISREYQHYDWEFERYWRLYQAFGRMGYNLDTPDDVFQRQLCHRFGEEAAPFVGNAYDAASKVLPRIVAYATRNLSAGYSWPEKRRWEDLPTYVNVRPSDTAQFLGIAEAVRLHLAGERSAKISPETNSRWFNMVSGQILRQVDQAQERIGSNRNKEFEATIVDMKILAHLTAYHSRRLHAGLSFAFFEQTGDLNALDDAIRHERDAIERWRNIVAVSDGVYPDNIIMGSSSDMQGNWKTELAELEKGLADLEKRRREFELRHHTVVARLDFGNGPVEKGYISVTSGDRYSRSLKSHGWHHANLLRSPGLTNQPGEKESHRDFLHGPPRASYTHSAFGIDISNGVYELLFTMVDRSAEPRDHGPMWVEAEGKGSTEWFEVPAGQLVEKKLTTEVVDGRLDIAFNSTTDGSWLVNSLEVARVDATIGHVPIRKSGGNRDILLRATIAGPNPIRFARIFLGGDKGGYKETAMRNTGRHTYQAHIAKSDLTDETAYFIEAEDEAGHRVRFPREGPAQPIRVAVTTDNEAPIVSHENIRNWTSGKPLAIRVEVADRSGIDAVYLRYRGISQHQDFHRLAMAPTGKSNEYRAEIPGSHIDARWDLMYYIEVIDSCGNGGIYPDLDKETPYIVVRLRR